MADLKGERPDAAAAAVEPQDHEHVGTQLDPKLTPTTAHRQAKRTEHAYHLLADVFPLLEGTEFAALVDDIHTHGLNEPVVLFEGMILDGRNRERACRAAGVEPRYVEKIFGSRADAVAFVISANIHRRHITTTLERRRLIEQLLKADPERSDRQISKEVDASHVHVGKVRRELEAAGDVETVSTSVDTRGRKQPRRRTPKPAAEAAKPEIAPAAEAAASDVPVEPVSEDPAASADARKAHYAADEPPPEQEPAGDETTDERTNAAKVFDSLVSVVRLKSAKAENYELHRRVYRLKGRVALLEIENERFKAENERLKVENEQLKAKIEQLRGVAGTPMPKGMSASVRRRYHLDAAAKLELDLKARITELEAEIEQLKARPADGAPPATSSASAGTAKTRK